MLFPDRLRSEPSTVDLEMQVRHSLNVHDIRCCMCVWGSTCESVCNWTGPLLKAEWSPLSFLGAVLKSGRWIKKLVFCCSIIPVQNAKRSVCRVLCFLTCDIFSYTAYVLWKSSCTCLTHIFCMGQNLSYNQSVDVWLCLGYIWSMDVVTTHSEFITNSK